MKYLVSLLLLVTSVAFATEPSHWVQIGNGVGVHKQNDPNATTLTLVYLDDANVISEDGYNGFEIRWVFPTEQTAQLSDGTKEPYIEMYTNIEYNCHTEVGRGKRTYMLSITDGRRISFSEDWRPIVPNSGASAIIEAIKARVCFKAN